MLQRYTQIYDLLVDAQTDVVKGASGNRAAAVRARQTLRTVQRLTKELVKDSCQHTKSLPKGSRPTHVFGEAL